MYINFRTDKNSFVDYLYAPNYQSTDDLKSALQARIEHFSDVKNLCVLFDQRLIEIGLIPQSLSGLVAVDGNTDQIMDAITQNLVDYVNLDDDDQTHYENARELDILKDTVADTVEHMQCRYLGEHDDLESYIREDLDDKFDIPYFVMICVDMDKLCDTYEVDHDYTFINGYLYRDVED